jgi:hypothetical protein
MRVTLRAVNSSFGALSHPELHRKDITFTEPPYFDSARQKPIFFLAVCSSVFEGEGDFCAKAVEGDL